METDDQPTARPAPAAFPTPGTSIVHEADGSRLVLVPGGEYPQGSAELRTVEGPPHRVVLSPFWIGLHPVTNAQYARFLEAAPETARPAFWGREGFDHPRQPVVGVDWADACSYCAWADLILPSEAQWEAAARGHDGRTYPWGEEAPTYEHANFRDGPGRTTSVDAHPLGTGPFGSQDLSGNVWEWCRDCWHPHAYSRRLAGGEPVVDPVETAGDGESRAARGGSWNYPSGNLRGAYRGRIAAGERCLNIGFRVALPAR